ncbi:MAG: hypothetical protein AAFR28_03620 [Pseudomonadota bacterium]
MHVLTGAHDAVADVVGALIGYELPSPRVALGSLGADGRLLGGVVFHDWQPQWRRIELSAAGADRRWMSRPLIAACADYAWRQLDAHVVYQAAPARFAFSAKLARALGAERVDLPEMRGPGEAEAVYILTRDAWERSRLGGVHGRS